MKQLMDDVALNRAITRISHEIIEKNKGVDNIVLVGIKTRGEFLAKRVADNLLKFEGVEVANCGFDISYYRDDIDNSNLSADILSVEVVGKTVILVDDVMYKGRTIRAAIDGVMHNGRPNSIQLAVVVDRGHRELPIRADYVGKNIPTSESERVVVKVSEIDDCEGVFIL